MPSNDGVSITIYLRHQAEPLRVVIAGADYESLIAEFTTKDDPGYKEIGCYHCTLTAGEESQSVLLIRIEEIQAVFVHL